eukprot:47420-Rhodomonas_salina.2
MMRICFPSPPRNQEKLTRNGNRTGVWQSNTQSLVLAVPQQRRCGMRCFEMKKAGVMMRTIFLRSR